METPTSTLRRRDEETPEQTRQRPTVAPAVDIYENNDELLVVADVPGVTREQVTIDLHRNQLTLVARRGAPDAGQENGPRDYYRSFLVPRGIDGEGISAELAHGVLRIHLPKSAAHRVRQIEIKPG